jgi:hypothetical protein
MSTATGYSYPTHLRDKIETLLTDPDNRLGGNLLGTYQSGGRDSEPAIRVGDPPRRFSNSGLEVVILALPTEQSFEQVSNPDGYGRTYVTGKQQFVLIQHRDTAVGSELDEQEYTAGSTIVEANYRLARWLHCGSGRYSPQDDSRSLKEQIIYTVEYCWSLVPLGHNNTP